MINPLQKYLIASQYYAPRGKERLIFLGEHISQRHLQFSDRLIGIKGMFPGLELSNDDDIINPRKIMLARDTIALNEVREAASFHLDIRFMQGFLQMYEIAQFIRTLLDNKKRVIIEHFNLIHQTLGCNADIIIGIGEEIIVTRPSVFGPLPESIYEIVHKSLKYRKMAHSAEEITRLVLQEDFNIMHDQYYFSDVRNGFVMKFYKKNDIDIELLEAKVKNIIEQSLPIAYSDEDHIKIGEKIVDCDGPRLQVKNTSEIKNFSLVKELIHDPETNTYCLIGLVDKNTENIMNRNTQYFLTRED